MYNDEVREDWPYALDCYHEDAKGEEWDRIEKTPGHDGLTYESAELTRLDEAAKSFTDKEAEEIAVTVNSGAVTVVWKCPVCHQEHTEEYTAGDFAD